MSRAPLTRRAFRARLAVVALGALALRVAYDFVVMRHLHLGLDSAWYFLEGGLIRHDHAFVDPQIFLVHHEPTAAWPPLYPAFLAVVQSVFGDAERTSQLAGAVTGTATVALTGLLARRFAGDVTALVAAALTACSPLLIATDGSMMSETLFVPLAVGTALATVIAVQEHRPGMWLVAGLLAGAATLIRVEGLLVAVCVVLPAAVLLHASWSYRLVTIGVVLAVVIAIVAPWVVRNAARVDDATIATVSSGTAIGGANCDRTYGGPGLGSWDYACIQPELRVKLSEAQWSNRNRDTGRRYATAHLSRLPLVVTARLARSAGVWPPGDQADRERLETRSRRWQWFVSITSPLVVVAGIAGLVLAGRRRPGISPVVGLVVTSALVVVLGYGNTRFRSTAEPALMIGVAILAAAIVRRLRPA